MHPLHFGMKHIAVPIFLQQPGARDVHTTTDKSIRLMFQDIQ